jgi:hypothetical protein
MAFTLPHPGISSPPAPGSGTPQAQQQRGFLVHLADVNGDGIADSPIQCERGSQRRWRGDACTSGRLTPGRRRPGPAFEQSRSAGWLLAQDLNLFPHCAWRIHGRFERRWQDGSVLLDAATTTQDARISPLSYDEHSTTWETEAEILQHSRRGPMDASMFLDVNGDGLPDMVKLNADHQPVTYINTGIAMGPLRDRA